MIIWENLNASSQIDDAISSSYDKDVLIFKHSTTCSISHMAKLRLEEKWDFDDTVMPYYLDLKSFRNISDEVSERFDIQHESPQIILIRKGECIYDASHFDISVEEIKETLEWHA